LREYSPTLDKVDALFGKDTSVYILRELYLSLYRLSTVKEPFTTDTALTAASLFYGSYRRTCNLYQMMLYFAMYPAMFKGSYFQFDTTDILRQYGAKFIQIDSVCGHLRPKEDEVYAKRLGQLR
jgi:hypothetical protein